jgi:hypothetical protein
MAREQVSAWLGLCCVAAVLISRLQLGCDMLTSSENRSVLGFYPEWGLSQAATSPVSHLQAGKSKALLAQ